MSARFDAVIVGAGPAGSSAAILLARAGWSVALVERQRFPRRKVCGECIAASNLALLDALGVGADVERLAGAELRRVALMRGAASVVAALPPADARGRRFGRALGREQLDTLLVRAGGAGRRDPVPAVRAAGDRRRGRSLSSAPAVEPARAAPRSRSRPRSSSLRTARGSRCPRSARSPRSSAGRATCSPSRPTSAAARSSPTCCRCCRSPAATAAWSSPTTASPRSPAASAKTGSAAIAKRIPASAPATCSRRSCAANAPACAAALAGAEREGPWLATGPIRPGVRLGHGDGIFRIGNAAGEAHPIVGEGISMAIQSAFVLAACSARRGGAWLIPTRRPTRRRRCCASTRRAGGSASASACASPPPSPTWRCGRGLPLRPGRWCAPGPAS